MIKKILLPILIFSICQFGYSQKPAETPEAKTERMQWFKDAKLGIFIHWGIYAVNGIDESWSFHNNMISYEDYMDQCGGFTAKNYNPDKWAKLFKESGARYTVLTSKHHDGVALWATKSNDLNVVEKTPAGKDLVTPYMEAMRKEGLKAGLYFSILDWSHPDYPEFTRTEKKYKDDPVRFAKFVDFYSNQLFELNQQFKPDLLWFDGDWSYDEKAFQTDKVKTQLYKQSPDLICNSRLRGGDYGTPEQGVPMVSPQDDYWELCMTINDSWGYQHNDKHYKSANKIIRIFTDVISMGGNLLLDVGPKEDGTIPEEQVEVLKELGRWTQKHDTAIYGSLAGISKTHFNGPSTLSKDSTILYLFFDYTPNEDLVLKGIKNKINRVWVVGNGTKLKHEIYMKSYWSQVPGLAYITVPKEVLDPQMTVLAVLLEGKIDLYKMPGQVIESN
jgi:alpha-L-fucosidase